MLLRVGLTLELNFNISRGVREAKVVLGTVSDETRDRW